MKHGNLEEETRDCGEVSLYSTDKTVIAIDSPVKQMILSLVTQEERTFEEIVRMTGKAKSTISVHVHDLINAGLIISKPDPGDQRRRILSLASVPIGKLTNEDRRPANEQILKEVSTLPFSEGDIAAFFRYILREFRTEAMNLGMNLDPVLERTGMRIGSMLLPTVTDTEITGKIRKMDRFWQMYGLGTITLISQKPLVIRVDGCFECEDLPITGHGSCAFDIGVLKTIFSPDFSESLQVIEIECYSAGYDHCTFLITERNDQHVPALIPESERLN